jgi:DeoR/GlpR family transcriptional regulator of sugar metabolism
VILLADSSKWGRGGNVAFAKVVPFSGIDTVVSDTNLGADARATLEQHGIEVILV